MEHSDAEIVAAHYAYAVLQELCDKAEAAASDDEGEELAKVAMEKFLESPESLLEWWRASPYSQPLL